MLHRLLPVASIVDRFSQSRYRQVSKWLLSRSGVIINGLPLWVSPQTYFDLSSGGPISIGDEVVISHGVRLLTHDFSMDRVALDVAHGLEAELEYYRVAPVTIEDGAFIGMGVIILPGVTVGSGSIVGAGSVVTKDVPPGAVVAGNPARVLSTTAELWEKSRTKFSTRKRRR